MNLPIKYRPQQFGQIIGQRVAVETAKASIVNSVYQLQTTYLLVGPSGSGKTTLARIMARSFNCKNRIEIEPCNQCRSCQSSLKQNHLAIKEINGADKNGVDDIRGIIESCQMNTIDAKYRIYIIDECHQISQSGQNAMLKLLEDPPPNSIFILCTTEEDKLLETIRSRARILRFSIVARDLVTGYLLNVANYEEIPLSEIEAQRIYDYNHGSIRQSLQTIAMLSDEVKVNDLCPQIAEEDLQNLFVCFQTNNYLGINQIVEKVVQQGFKPKQLLDDLINMTINLMASNNSSSDFIENANRIVEVIVPGVTKLRANTAQTDCRLILYHAAVVWQTTTDTAELEPQPNRFNQEESRLPLITVPQQINEYPPTVTPQYPSSQTAATSRQDSNYKLPNYYPRQHLDEVTEPAVDNGQFLFATEHRPYPL